MLTGISYAENNHISRLFPFRMIQLLSKSFVQFNGFFFLAQDLFRLWNYTYGYLIVDIISLLSYVLVTSSLS